MKNKIILILFVVTLLLISCNDKILFQGKFSNKCHDFKDEQQCLSAGSCQAEYINNSKFECNPK